MGHPKGNGEQPKRKIELEVTQDANGNCVVKELNLETQETRQVATFYAETRTITMPGQWGPELAIRDVAEIRATIFAKTMDNLVNGGKVDLG